MTPLHGDRRVRHRAVHSRLDLHLLSIGADDVVEDEHGDAPQAVSAGVPFLFVPVRDRTVLGRASLELVRWRELLAAAWAPHVYVFCRDAEGEGVDIRARMFAPAMNVAEDPATGEAPEPARAHGGESRRRRTVGAGGRGGGTSVRVGEGVLRI
jgi:trans-2,3-dihydro-3-hydroxyanthranilate isomerase